MNVNSNKINIEEITTFLEEINSKNIYLIQTYQQALEKKDTKKAAEIKKELDENMAKCEEANKKLKALKKDNIQIWATPKPENESTDKFVKFKNIMVPFRLQTDPTLYLDKAKTGWYSIKKAISSLTTYTSSPEAQAIYEQIHQKSLIPIQGVSYIINKTQTTKEKISNKVLFVGEYLKIKKLQKKFSHNLQSLGFNPVEIFHHSKKDDYINKSQLQKNITEELASKHNINYNGKDFDFEILNNISDNVKMDSIKNLLWPQLRKSLGETFEISQIVTDMKSKNQYLKMVQDFATKNNLLTETVIHGLINSPDLLAQKDLKGFKKLLKNKDEIIENQKKYDELTNNANIKMAAYAQAINSINKIYDSLEISDEAKANYKEEVKNVCISIAKDKSPLTFNEIKTKITENIKQIKSKETTSSVAPTP